jgi:phenylacetic acid degradation protein PaaD
MDHGYGRFDVHPTTLVLRRKGDQHVPSDNTPDEDLARRSAEAMWAGDAASKSLGMRILEVGPGTAVLGMTVRADMINGWDLCHGGLIAALADSAFAFACNSRGVVTVASGFEVTLLEAGRPSQSGRLWQRQSHGRRRLARSPTTATCLAPCST